LEGAKQAVRINPQYQEDFTAAVNFIAESVEPLTRQNPRNIAVTNSTNPNQTQGNQGRGRARHNNQSRGHHYRGGYQGRNTPYDQQRGGRYGNYRGRYQGQGRGRSRFGGRYQGQRNPAGDDTYFSRSEWDALTNQERQDAIRAQSQRRLESLRQSDIASVISQITTHTNAQAQAAGAATIAQVSTTPSNNNTTGSSAFGGRASYRGG
jgi:hypothetical protein